MRTLVALTAVFVCALAEPQVLLGRDLPLLHQRFGVGTFGGNVFSSVNPFTREIIRGVPDYTHYTGLKSQYYDRDLTGQAKYGHIEPGQSHHAVQDAFGNKIGGFSYYNAEGKLIQVSYVADGAGYRVASNDLPVDTPEVHAAKIAHLAEHEKVRLIRSRRAITPASSFGFLGSRSLYHSGLPNLIDYRIGSPVPHAYPTTLTVPVVKPDGFLADTPEVVAAKAHHFAEVAAAKYRNYSPFYPVTSPVSVPLTHHLDYRYTSPITHAFPTTHGIPLVTGDGFLADTPEVVAAKALHFSEVAKARARVSYPFHF